MNRLVWSVLIGMVLALGAGCHSSESPRSGGCACSHTGTTACGCAHCKGSSATCTCPK